VNALPAPSARIRALHLLVLSAFAIADPNFQELAKTPEFFVVRGYRAADVVLYSVALVVAVPALLVAIELVVARIHERALSVTHQAFVFVLAFLTFGDALRRVHSVSPLLPAFLLAVVSTVAYRFWSPARSFLTVAAFAPVLFISTFLVRVHLEALSPNAPRGVSSPVIHSRTPVVLVVFDEFALSSLLAANGHIDAARYPHFAALARSSTWFRNATTVYDVTDRAVPAILTGRFRRHGQLPSVDDYPRNLFTLLGGSYHVHALQAETRLCPQSICPDSFPTVRSRLVRLASDVETTSIRRQPVWRGDWSKPDAEVTRFLAGVAPSSIPTLHFMHVLLPHIPYRYLPSGRAYANGQQLLGYRAGFRWSTNPWYVDHNYERYLLQLAYTDHVLGQVVARLKATGLWSGSLVVVTADHGVSFRPGGYRRYVTAENVGDIAPIPLFVKLPHERHGKVDRGRARPIDVVPTIADVLRVRSPWKLDGTSLLRPDRSTPSTVTVTSFTGNVVTVPWRVIRSEQAATMSWKLRAFGSGTESIFAEGRDRDLLGKSVTAFPAWRSASMRAHLQEPAVVRFDPDSRTTPSRVDGSVDGSPARPLKLAVVVNGRIAAVTRTLPRSGSSDFGTFVPDSAFHRGRNTIAVFALHVRGDGQLALARIGPKATSQTVASAAP
jgi:Sulfatase